MHSYLSARRFHDSRFDAIPAIWHRGRREGQVGAFVRAGGSTMPIEVGQSAPDIVFGRGDGSMISLAELRSEGPLVLAFLRHFG